MCRVTILDENGIPVTVEVSREIYQVFVDYEREVERQRKADFRHRDARSQSFIVKGEIFPFHSWNLDKQRATVHIQYSSF